MSNNKLKLSNISIEKLSNYIFELFETKLKGCSKEILVSYVNKIDYSIDDIDISGVSKLFEKSFFLEKSDDDFSLLGLGNLFSITESGQARFTLTEKKIKTFNETFMNNWDDYSLNNVPVFMGGMKFTLDRDNELWEDYSDSNWFIPKIQIFKKDDQNYLVYNFFISSTSQIKKIVEDFSIIISSISSQEKGETQYKKVQVKLKTGTSPKDKKKWCNSVKEVLDLIEKGVYEKVVLSRMIELHLDNEPVLTPLLMQLGKKYPDCYLFSFHSGKSTFFGASPEKLIKFTNGTLETDALAGSAPRGKTEDEDIALEKELLSSKKNLLEHNMVIKYLNNQLLEFAEEIEYSNSPNIKKYLNIQHLWTPIRVKLKPQKQLFNILENLHPTPAVCGIPKSDTINFIKKNEDYSRGLYTGILGWFNLNGEGEFFVPLRSALLKKKNVYAFAGSGLVEGSDPTVEYKETELKFEPILSLFENED